MDWWWKYIQTGMLGAATTLILDMPMQDDAANTAVDDVSASDNNGTVNGLNTEDISVAGPGGSLIKALDPANAGEAVILLGVEISRAANQTGCIQWFSRRTNPNNLDGVFGDTSVGVGSIHFLPTLDSIKLIDTDTVELTCATGVATSDWHHYAVVLAANGTASLYVDGELAGSFSGVRTGNIAIDAVLTDGQFNTIGGPVCGVKIYDEARTLEQIEDDYLQGVSESTVPGGRMTLLGAGR